MHFEHRVFCLAKDAQHPDDYQDACAVNPATGMAAIADGVSASLFAAHWAQVLTRAVVDDPPDVCDRRRFAAWIERCRAAWSSPIAGDELPWHQRARLPTGAFSTLLWIKLTEIPAASLGAADFRLEAQAIGDSCFFLVRQNRLCRAFPVLESRHFGTNPPTVGSVDQHHDDDLVFNSLAIDCHGGDLLVLATDALAAWSLAACETGHSPDWQSWWQMSDSQWQAWVGGLRREQSMRYDDTTLLLLRLGGDSR
jgi:hypothetical protein